EPPPSPDTPAPSARRKPARRATGASGSASSRTIKAKFAGRCLCGRSYAAGESIAKNAQGWGHPECRTATG
ncbi:ribonuclease HI, partial [Streptomyces sp. SID2999]|nr:ribonuclease HI [Streptomyces sp. SID2999]